ncbi:MAG: winged helix-turn-helix domain-containing protein [Deltaproteobacteria bacterium]|jgi:DNA-binding MarR family transcriptional regulator
MIQLPAAPTHTEGWTFLTNHAHVLFCLAQDPSMRLRDVATHVGITERAAQRIVAELAQEGYVTVKKDGRRNTYRIRDKKKLRHHLESNVTIRALLDLVGP